MEVIYDANYKGNKLAKEYRKLELEIEIFRTAINELKEQKAELITKRKQTRQQMRALGVRI